MALDDNALLALISNDIPDNTTGVVTPARVRSPLEEMVSSALNLVEPTTQVVTGPVNYTGGLQANGVEVSALSNRIIIKQASDFGVIDSTKEYFLDGVVNFTGTGLSIEVPAGGIFITGYNFDLSGLRCLDAGFTLFTSPAGGSGDVLFSKLNIEVQGAGSKVFDITGDTGIEVFKLDQVSFTSCVSLGVVTEYGQGLETVTARIGGTPELELDGAWSRGYAVDNSLVAMITDGAYSIFKAGPTFTMQSRFKTNQGADLNSTVALFDFSPANFPNSSTLQLDNCVISRNGLVDASDATLTPNITASDLPCDWNGNNGLPNTFVGGELNITSEATTTIVSSGVFVDLAGTYTSDDLQHFDEPSNGQLRHLGTSPVEFRIGGQLVLESSSNNDVALKIVIFRDATTSFEDGKTVTRVINNLQGGRDVAYFVLEDNIILNQNDYVKVQVANIGATNNITAEIDSYFNASAR